MYKLSVVIVNFNSGKHLSEALDSLFKSDLDLKVFVIDNASIDESIEIAKKKFPKVKFILNKDNLGFGAANNQALKQLNGGLVLILNPDTKIMVGTLEAMVKFMDENSDVGAATCKLIHENGSLDWASHRGFPTPWASFLYFFLKDDSLYHQSYKDMEKVHVVDAISGSFFLTRAEILKEVDYFDEDYWLYAEDLDLSFKIKKAGYKIMYVPNVQAVHLKGISSGIKEHSQDISTASDSSREKAFNSFYETMKIFYKKHLEKDYPFLINWLVYLGIDIKWWLAKRSKKV